jgi:hypothetical protein
MTAFDEWLDAATPGETFTYHRGYLPREREVAWLPVRGIAKDEAAHRAALTAAAKVDSEADAAMRSHMRGEVFLTQRKTSFLNYQYLATRRPVRLKSG